MSPCTVEDYRRAAGAGALEVSTLGMYGRPVPPRAGPNRGVVRPFQFAPRTTACSEGEWRYLGDQVPFPFVPLDRVQDVGMLGISFGDRVAAAERAVPHLEEADRQISAVVADRDRSRRGNSGTCTRHM